MADSAQPDPTALDSTEPGEGGRLSVAHCLANFAAEGLLQ